MLWIKGGQIYDPLNNINGDVRDLFVNQGVIVEKDKISPQDISNATIVDAHGLIIMPGGVDIHSHIAGPKVNAGRILRPEDHRHDPVARTADTRSGSGFTVPSTFVTGYRYAQLGYTTVVEAAVPPLEARHAHEELADIPIVDKASLVLMGNNHFIMNMIREGKKERLLDYVTWLLKSTGGYGIKVVNPGGVANWRKRGNVSHLDDEVWDYGVTPRQIIDALLDLNLELGLPHSVHLHCTGLGQPGSDEMTLATMKLAAGRPLHITHLQFNSYKDAEGLPFSSGAEQLASYINNHPNLTVDVGQVVFGPATTMTADGPLQYELYRLSRDRWVNKDVEGETGSGVVPMVYNQKSYVGALQWLIGMELFLLVKNPWQVFLTTDHPNAGPFTAYPWIIKLLMNKDYRNEIASGLNKQSRGACGLAGLEREYNLYEIAIITRAGTARALGLTDKGHLGPGAQADITIYHLQADHEAMFSTPAYVFKGGQLVVKDGKIVEAPVGKTYLAGLHGRSPVESWLAPEFAALYSISMANYPVEEERYAPWEVVPCI